MNEYGRLDRNAFQLGHEVASWAVSIGEERITCRDMDDKLGCTVRVPQREKRKGFGNFSTWGMGNGVSGWTGAFAGNRELGGRVTVLEGANQRGRRESLHPQK